MKKFLALVLVMFFGWQVDASEFPNCFKPGVVSGKYIIAVDLQKISKAGLVQLLREANGKAVTPVHYPIFSSDANMFLVVGMRSLADGDLPSRESVEREVKHLGAVPGVVSVECDYIVGPYPRAGGGN